MNHPALNVIPNEFKAMRREEVLTAKTPRTPKRSFGSADLLSGVGLETQNPLIHDARRQKRRGFNRQDAQNAKEEFWLSADLLRGVGLETQNPLIHDARRQKRRGLTAKTPRTPKR